MSSAKTVAASRKNECARLQNYGTLKQGGGISENNMLNTILFDVDGVFLSEERYFDASALTVRELLLSRNYLGLGGDGAFQTSYSNEEITDIRKRVFLQDKVLHFLKSRGMNANWDMIYVTFSAQLIDLIASLPDEPRKEAAAFLRTSIGRNTLGQLKAIFKAYPKRPDFSRFLTDFSATDATKQELISYLNTLADRRLGIRTYAFHPKSTLWHVGEHASQEWYVGDENVLSATGEPPVQTGKRGFMNDEVTLVAPDHVRRLFRNLRSAGIRIGIATGRPHLETYRPFAYLHWLELLDDEHIATADDVLAAERAYNAAPLAKPHPFTYLLAYYGKQSDIRPLTVREPDKLAHGADTLIVGDSPADLLCARQIGCLFAAVLTGLSGKQARSEFESLGADFILDSVADVAKLVRDLRKKHSV